MLEVDSNFCGGAGHVGFIGDGFVSDGVAGEAEKSGAEGRESSGAGSSGAGSTSKIDQSIIFTCAHVHIHTQDCIPV